MVRQCGRPLYLTVLLLSLVFFISQINKNCITSDGKYSSCVQSFLPSLEENSTSLCSRRATKRGLGQKILSISFFGPVENPKIFSLNNSMILFEEFINEMQQVYADNWTLRVYHDGRILNQTVISYFEQHHSFIDFCNVTDIGLSFIPPKVWRFLPACDDKVNIMASRDLDSPLTLRERAAINEWLLSNFTFHSMRDHPYHSVPMMGGMWAFRVENDREFSRIIRSKIFDQTFIQGYSLNKDQQFLTDQVWPYAQDNTMAHDSFLCFRAEWNKHHRPFPTQRPVLNSTNHCYIGCPKPCCINWYFDNNPCPTACRPKEHQDWIYC